MKNLGLVILSTAVIAGCGPGTPYFAPVVNPGTILPTPTAITDQASCINAGGSWLAGSICKFIFRYPIMGYGTSYYWLPGPSGYGPWAPLVRPAVPTETDTAAYTFYSHDANDKLTYQGDPRLGSIDQRIFSTGDGCRDDQGTIPLIVSDLTQTYTLSTTVPAVLANTGILYFGLDKSRKSNWSDNCVEANNNVPIFLVVTHCLQNSATVVCP